MRVRICFPDNSRANFKYWSDWRMFENEVRRKFIALENESFQRIVLNTDHIVWARQISAGEKDLEENDR